MVVRASAESRRAVLGGLVAGVAALAASSAQVRAAGSVLEPRSRLAGGALRCLHWASQGQLFGAENGATVAVVGVGPTAPEWLTAACVSPPPHVPAQAMDLFDDRKAKQAG